MFFQVYKLFMTQSKKVRGKTDKNLGSLELLSFLPWARTVCQPKVAKLEAGLGALAIVTLRLVSVTIEGSFPFKCYFYFI